MKIETFFEKFELFAEAPGAVARMRELVLDLAISGRLVEKKAEWEVKQLKLLATKIGSGATPAGGRESYFAKGIPLIRSMNVYFNGFDHDGLVFLSDEQARQLSNVIVQAGDVLLNITGASIGRVTIAPKEMAGARVNQHVTIIRPTSELLPRFLSVYLASPSTQRMINEIQVGATRQALTKSMIEQFETPVPTLAEQKRIVAKVDELMALCDQLEAQQQERETRFASLSRASLDRFAEAPTPANLNFIFHKSYDVSPAELRKAILALAVQGKLVPQDPKDEPASELILKIRESRRRWMLANNKTEKDNLSEIGDDEIPIEIPQNWLWIRLGDLCSRVSDGFHHSAIKLSHGVRYISATHIFDGKIEWDSELFVSENDYRDLYFKAKQNFGDILVVNRGAGCGDAAIVDTRERFCFQNAAIIGFDTNLILSEYMLLLLRASKTRFLERFMRGGAQPMISNSLLNTHVVPLAPRSEQHRIVARVDQLMTLVDQLEAQLAASKSSGKNLLEALVAELAA